MISKVFIEPTADEAAIRLPNGSYIYARNVEEALSKCRYRARYWLRTGTVEVVYVYVEGALRLTFQMSSRIPNQGEEPQVEEIVS